MRRPLRTTWIIGAVFWATVFRLSTGLAQTADPITSSGLNTEVNLSGTPPLGTVQYDITGGTRAGANLFHSFGDFNVPNGNIANFRNDTGLTTSNILGRVTGGNVSNIFGTIQTTEFGNANLFLVNPSGIIFGPTASLNVGGSVAFTTADYLRLADDVRFNAVPNTAADALLSSKPVTAYGFLGSNPGAITVQGGQLRVSEGHGISVLGGNITIQDGALENGAVQPARLSAPNGQINLATARSPGEFLQDLTAAPNINGISFRSFGSAHLAPGSTVDVSHADNGKVSIRGGQLALEIQNTVLDTANSSAPTAVASGEDTIVLAPRSSIISQTSSLDPSPDISISADRITIVGVPGSKENFFEKPFTGMESTTKGAGSAGDITLRATGDLAITKVVNLQSIAMPQSTGTAGNINLISTKGNILMTEGAVESQALSLTYSSGNTGTVTASAREGDIVLDGGNLYTQSQGSGRAGSVEIIAKNLSMHAGLLSNDNFFSTHKPGGITVTLSGKLTMKADPSLDVPDFVFPNSLIATSAFNPTEAPAGDITLTAKDILATGGSLITSETFATGAGGQLKIVADTLQLKDGSRIKSGSTIAPPVGDLPQGITPTGAGGDITIHTLGPTGAVLIDGEGSGILADTEGTGVGGTINLSARTLTIQNGGTISTETSGTTSSATGGAIMVKVADHVTMTNNASIAASSTGPANAGNITIRGLENPARLISIDGSTLSTETSGSGAGGTVTIDNARAITVTNKSTISTLSEDKGQAGNIFLHATDSINLTKGSSIHSDAASFSPEAAGGGGLIHLKAPRINVQGSLMSASTFGAGDGGTILLEAQRLNLGIDTDVSTFTQGRGKGGNITIRGLDGQGRSAEDVAITGGSVLRSRTSNAGDAGEIRIDAGRLIISDNSQINANSETGSGAGGNIYINGDSITLKNGGTVSAKTSGSGTSATGGTIEVKANQVQLQSRATITANSNGKAKAGDIKITAADGLTMQSNSEITTEVKRSNSGGSAGGGNITITTSPEAMVYIQDSKISASVADGPGGGGDIKIDPQFVVLQNSRILAQADQERGGNITIITSVFQQDANSEVNADAERGVNGTVRIQAPYAPAGGKIQPLGNRPLQATSLLNQRCAAMTGGQFSSFTVARRNNLPTEPGGWLSSSLALTNSGSHDDTMTSKGLGASPDEPMKAPPLLSLRQIAPAGFLTQAFAAELSKGCRS